MKCGELLRFWRYTFQLINCISINSTSESDVKILFLNEVVVQDWSRRHKGSRKWCIRSSAPVGRLFKFGNKISGPIRRSEIDRMTVSAPHLLNSIGMMRWLYVASYGTAVSGFADQPYDHDVPISYQPQTYKLCGRSKVKVTTAHAASNLGTSLLLTSCQTQACVEIHPSQASFFHVLNCPRCAMQSNLSISWGAYTPGRQCFTKKEQAANREVKGMLRWVSALASIAHCGSQGGREGLEQVII